MVGGGLKLSYRVVENLIGFLILITLFSCGGGDLAPSQQQSPPAAFAAPPLTGVFIDAAVEGLNYRTETQSGETNSAGEFLYEEGQNISFEFGGVELGQTLAKPIITPLNLYPRRDQYQDRLLSFLQTLDSDADTTNGIQLSASSGEQIQLYVDQNNLSTSFPFQSTRDDFADLAGQVSNRTSWLDTDVATANFNAEIQALISDGSYMRPIVETSVEDRTLLIQTGLSDLPVLMITEFGAIFALVSNPADAFERTGFYLRAPDESELLVNWIGETTLSVSDGDSTIIIEQIDGETIQLFAFDGTASMEVLEQNSSSSTAAAPKEVRLLPQTPVQPLLLGVGLQSFGDCAQFAFPGPTLASEEEVRECVRSFGENFIELREVLNSRSTSEIAAKLLRSKAWLSAIPAVSDSIEFVQDNNLDTALSIAIDTTFCRLGDAFDCFTSAVDIILSTWGASTAFNELAVSQFICPQPGVGGSLGFKVFCRDLTARPETEPDPISARAGTRVVVPLDDVLIVDPLVGFDHRLIFSSDLRVQSGLQAVVDASGLELIVTIPPSTPTGRYEIRFTMTTIWDFRSHVSDSGLILVDVIGIDRSGITEVFQLSGTAVASDYWLIGSILDVDHIRASFPNPIAACKTSDSWLPKRADAVEVVITTICGDEYSRTVTSTFELDSSGIATYTAEVVGQSQGPLFCSAIDVDSFTTIRIALDEHLAFMEDGIGVPTAGFLGGSFTDSGFLTERYPEEFDFLSSAFEYEGIYDCDFVPDGTGCEGGGATVNAQVIPVEDPLPDECLDQTFD